MLLQMIRTNALPFSTCSGIHGRMAVNAKVRVETLTPDEIMIALKREIVASWRKSFIYWKE